MFRSTLPRKYDARQTAQPITANQFRSTLPRESDPSSAKQLNTTTKFRSTLPRRERRRRQAQGRGHDDVSIHAPAKGATASSIRRRSRPGGFDPRSREGSDAMFGMAATSVIGFRSTLPRRERHELRDLVDQPHHVSIHAPVKGATGSARHRGRPRAPGFDPRSREGSDDGALGSPARAECFDPRSREGSDLPIWEPGLSPCQFRSTLPRRERRGLVGEVGKLQLVSIHAPAKGATGRCREQHRVAPGFDPRSREGSDSPRLR